MLSYYYHMSVGNASGNNDESSKLGGNNSFVERATHIKELKFESDCDDERHLEQREQLVRPEEVDGNSSHLCFFASPTSI